jgi:hypothetical protein
MTIIVSKFLYTYSLKVTENRVLRRIFGPKRDEVTGGRRKLHTEELHNLYSSPSIIRRRMHIEYWWEIQKERDHWEDQDVDWWTILKWILER